MYSVFSFINVFFFFLICLSGPAYFAGLIGKDVAPTAVVKCHLHHRPRSEWKEREMGRWKKRDG